MENLKSIFLTKKQTYHTELCKKWISLNFGIMYFLFTVTKPCTAFGMLQKCGT